MAGIKKYALIIMIVLSALIFLFPVITTISNSFMTMTEIARNYGAEGTGLISLIPGKIAFNQYYELLIERFEYLNMFWNSVKLSVIITFFHVLIAVLTAFVFAKVKFRGREALFFVFIVVMMMPFQVTLLPNYIQAKFINIYDTYLAIILPGVFAPFGVFLLRQFMKCIPDEFIDAMVLESNSVIDVLRIAIVPLVKPGIIALAVLTFAENWNMVEQPLVLLQDITKYPLSVALNSIAQRAGSIAFAGSVIYMIPILILYFYFEEHIISGLTSAKF